MPAPERGQFLSRFSGSSGKLDVGSSAGGIKFPPGTPPQAAQLAQSIFHQGYINAMRFTLWLPITVLAVGALSVLLVRQRRRPSATGATEAEEPAVAVG